MKPLGYLLAFVPFLVGLAGEPAQAKDRDSKDISKQCNAIADARDLDGHKRQDFLKDCKSRSNQDTGGWVGSLFGGGKNDDRPPVDEKTDWCMDQARQHGITGAYARNNYVKQCRNRN